MPRRFLAVLACAASACALSAPSALAAQRHERPAAVSGVVLSAAGHGLRLVGRDHRVARVRVASARGLRRGDVVTVRGGRARVAGHVRKVSFLARVVRGSGRGATLKLGDGSTFKLGGASQSRNGRGRGARSAAGVTLDLRGLAPGQELLVTIAIGERGDIVLTVKLRKGAKGVRGGEQRGEPDPGDEGECADDEYLDDDGWCVYDDELGDEVDGTVTALAPDGSSLTLAPDDGEAGETMTIPVEDPSLLEGIEVSDDVAVTLDADGTAIDVELLDWVEDPGDGDGAGDE